MTFLGVPVHPIVVHMPVAVAVLLPLLAFSAIYSIRRQWLPERVWVAVLALTILGAISAVLAARTGHWEERRVKQVVERSLVHEHEERAEVFVWGFIGLAALAALPLLPQLKRRGPALKLAAAVGSLVVAGLAGWVGHSGGELVYRYDAPQAYQQGASAATTVQDQAAPTSGHSGDTEEAHH